ncbi:MAG: LTA synthase family protein [Bacilli bacterium]|nr:LTA synthase family protein [Bacilli bacterium]
MKQKFNDFIKLFKIHSKTYFKTNVLFMTFVLTSLINGCLVRFLTVKNYFAISPIIADLAIILMIGAFGYFIKPKNQFKYFFTWSIVFSLVCIVNSMYYTNYVSFASFSLLKTSLQIVDVSDAVVDNVMEFKDFAYLWQILAMIFVNKSLKKKQYYVKVSKIEKGKVRALNTMVAGLIALGLFISTLSSVDISRLTKQWNREYLVMKFGIYTYQINDLFATVKSQLNPLFGYDQKSKEFREFYDKKEENTESNEYTDIFKGKNVIVLHAESIQNFTIGLQFNGEAVTPNLNKLSSEGLYFSNFYAQESVGTSSDTEFTMNTSLLPASSGTVFINYWDREYITIPKSLKEQGYYTFSMHGNNGTFWNRNNAHESLGYDNFYYYTKDYDIDETIGLGLSDKSFFRQSTNIIKGISEQHQNFYGLLIMLSNHTPFTNNGEDITDFDVTMKYDKVNEETGETETLTAPYLEGTKLGSYIKSVHYADEAIGEFINELDEAGLLENTVIVIYGDHDAKLKKSEYRWFYNYNPETNDMISSDDPNYVDVDYYNYELNRSVPFVIWTKNSSGNQLLNKNITEVMGMYDVQPTLGNMFGFSNKYALGTDIFSLSEDEENVVVFPDGNWLTNKMYYSQSQEEGKILNLNETVSVDYINDYTALANKYVDVSDATIVYDLIKKTNETKKITDGVENK